MKVNFSIQLMNKFYSRVNKLNDLIFCNAYQFFANENYASFQYTAQNTQNESQEGSNFEWDLNQGYTDIARHDLISILGYILPDKLKRILFHLRRYLYILVADEEIYEIKSAVIQCVNTTYLNQKFIAVPNDRPSSRVSTCYNLFILSLRRLTGISNKPTNSGWNSLTSIFGTFSDNTIKSAITIIYTRRKPIVRKLNLKYLFHKRF